MDETQIFASLGEAMLTSTAERLQHHRLVLESVEVTSLFALDNMTLSGPIIPQLGIVIPRADLYQVQPSLFQHSYPVRIGGIVRQLKAQPLPITSHRPGLFTKCEEASSNPSGLFTLPMRYKPLESYLVAKTLELADNTIIILSYPDQCLYIIAERIIMGKNVCITWERTLSPQLDSQANPGERPTACGPFCEDGAKSRLSGVDGEAGTDEVKVSETESELASKRVFDGADTTPRIELWTLSLQMKPRVIDTAGQQVVLGDNDGDTGDGRGGSNGWDAPAGFLRTCMYGHSAGGTEVNGRITGDDVTGGDGRHAGRISLYAPSPVLTVFRQSFLENASGGESDPGALGRGGAGGKQGVRPGLCEPTRQDGRGGEMGTCDQQGCSEQCLRMTYGDAVQLHVIDAEKFRCQLLAPVLGNLYPTEACEGDVIKVSGLRFSTSDKLLMDGTPVSTSLINDLELEFHVPAGMTGGSKTVQLKQRDGTLSNPVTLCVKPSITAVLPSTYVRPGSTVTLQGSGFSSTVAVTINEHRVLGVDFLDTHTLELVINRPHNVEQRAFGEPAVIQVYLPEGPNSNRFGITLDTYRIAVFGDSVLSGTGLMDQQKIHSKVTRVIQQQGVNIGVYCDIHAHCGAIIGLGNNYKEDAPHRVIHTDYPTILQQVDAAGIGHPETVDLILANGGINDINVRRIFNPAFSEVDLSALILDHCYVGMKNLLQHIVCRFRNARVIVLGYYPMLSQDSDMAQIPCFLALLGLPFGAVVGATLSKVFKAQAITRATLFAEEAEKALQRAIDEVNLTLTERRVLLVQPEFGQQHAALASDPHIFGVRLTEGRQDSIGLWRSTLCDTILAGRSDVATCKVLSVGQPNEQGAQAYLEEIVALLHQLPHFPPEFFWGVSTAAYQVEGSIVNNDWHKFTTSPVIHDRVKKLTGIVGERVDLRPPGIAVQHGDLHTLREDLDRVKLLGMNCYRFSIEWSRINPIPGASDEVAWSFYDEVIRELHKRRLKPIVTLNHMTLPDWVLTPPMTNNILLSTAVEDDEFRNSLRGWEDRRTVDAFVAYVQDVVRRYKDQVDTWITLNEPVASMIGVGYIAGIWPPGFTMDGNRARKAYFNLLRGHVHAYNAIKRIYGRQPSRVGIAHAMMHVRLSQEGRGLGSVNEAAKDQFNYFYNVHLLDSLVNDVVDTAIEQSPANRNNMESLKFYGLAANEEWFPRVDFIGLNYYRAVYAYHDHIVSMGAGFSGGAFINDLTGRPEKHQLLNDMGWEIYPKGIYHILKSLHGIYRLPVLVTENGLAEAGNAVRAPYIVAHLEHVQRAMQEGVHILGYIHWTIVDNYEWHQSYQSRARFGLFVIDRAARDTNRNLTLPRHITEGALALQYIIADNSLCGALERFGTITPNASSVSQPVKSAGTLWIWDGADDAGPAFNLYLSKLSSGQYIGMAFLHKFNIWQKLTNINWDGRDMSFNFTDGEGRTIMAAATSTDGALRGTMSFSSTEIAKACTWKAKREVLNGNWASDDPDAVPRLAHFDGLEVGFAGWQSKWQNPYPSRRWSTSSSITIEGSIDFAVGSYGDFRGGISSGPGLESILSGEIHRVSPGGNAVKFWLARRLPDDLP